MNNSAYQLYLLRKSEKEFTTMYSDFIKYSIDKVIRLVRKDIKSYEYYSNIWINTNKCNTTNKTLHDKNKLSSTIYKRNKIDNLFLQWLCIDIRSNLYELCDHLLLINKYKSLESERSLLYKFCDYLLNKYRSLLEYYKYRCKRRFTLCRYNDGIVYVNTCIIHIKRLRSMIDDIV